MKYKLINFRTKEEHLCDKVTLEGYDYYVSDGEIFLGDYYIDFRTDENKIEHFKDNDDWVLVGICGSKKIIATTNPNIDIPKVVDEVEELAEKFIGCKYEDIEDSIDQIGYDSFKRGYNKSQETHSFSEEDMIDFYRWLNKNGWQDYNDIKHGLFVNVYGVQKQEKELLQLWKEQKPKIIYYE